VFDNIAIIIPSLNPDDKFIRVLDGMKAQGFNNFLIVDDGSDELHQEPFLYANKFGYTVLKHEVNLGKGQALKDAFNYVYSNMPDIKAVITIDGDGQHTAEDAVKLAQHLNENETIVFGCRDFDAPNVPTHNKLGNKITAFTFKLLFGMNISDAQTGLRGIPRKYLFDFANNVEGTRFEYESNILIYMTEQNINFHEIKIQTLYLEENKSSHFRPFQDSIRIYKPILGKSKSFKFLISSALSTLVDETVFTILNKIFNSISVLILQTLLTTGLARISSAILNYTLNKKYVFKDNSSHRESALKYAILAIMQYCVSWLLCTLVFSLILKVGFIRTVLKIAIDFCLFILSYIIQKKWVFKNDNK